MAFGIRKREKEESRPLPTRHFSLAQEKAVAKAVGGQPTPNSGATAWVKGDIVVHGENGWLIECKTKTSSADSISIKKEWFKKNKEEAAFMGKPYQAVVFSFGPGEENHYIIDEYLFKELQEYLNSSKN